MRSLWSACSKLGQSPLLSTSVLLIYFLTNLLHPHLTYAANGDSIALEDHNHPRLLDVSEVLDSRNEGGGYESNFIGFDRSLIGRAEEDDQALANNVPGQLNIDEGGSQFWIFPSPALSLPKSPPTPGLPSPLHGEFSVPTPESPEEIILYISLTTCIQPTSTKPNPNGAPDQLKLFVSKNSDNKRPSATNNDFTVSVDGGFGSLNISVKSDVYFGIFAPTNPGYSGFYNYQLTASIDGFFASYNNDSNMFFIDSDTNSALIWTNQLTNSDSSTHVFQQWMSGPPPFSIFVQNQDNLAILGMQNSVCALQNFADVRAPADIDTAMTLAGDGQPRQQFHVRTLNGSSTYYAIVAIVGNSSNSGNGVVGGGGTIWNSTIQPAFSTKTGMLLSLISVPPADSLCLDNNCALLFNLTFCTSVAYAAPANFTKWPNVTALGELYDQYAQQQYVNFSYSLQQVPCKTDSSAQYSLAKNCDDCDEAYRQWLCAVTIPRCEDFSNPASYLMPRAVSQNFTNATLEAQFANDPTFDTYNKSRMYYNSSRNPMIDAQILPGPYKEVLPCSDLCYALVQSCPASMQFVCPLDGHGLNYTYGTLDTHSNDIKCNFPGAGISDASSSRSIGVLPAWAALGVALVIMTI